MVFKNLIMKKYIYILIFIPFLTFSQGINLELNQVLLLDLDPNNSVNTTYVVPEGKVWKATSVQGRLYLSQNSGTSTYTDQIMIYINDKSVMLGYSSGGNIAAYNSTSFPMWLPEGTTIQGSSGAIFLSVLEFNAQ
tara:strand:+ start:1178 stop:1585 length:408 start_codon:yes stop_codon:yes gene_type:complete